MRCKHADALQGSQVPCISRLCRCVAQRRRPELYGLSVPSGEPEQMCWRVSLIIDIAAIFPGKAQSRAFVAAVAQEASSEASLVIVVQDKGVGTHPAPSPTLTTTDRAPSLLPGEEQSFDSGY